MQTGNILYQFDGTCPICRKKSRFTWTDYNERDSLVCHVCDGRSVPRERALMLVLNRERPDWRDLSIHESSPATRGASLYLKTHAKNYIATQFMKGVPLGASAKGFRCEDLHKQTFADETFDVVVSLDVMEHVNEPELVLKDVARTLKPGGLYIFTAPTYKYNVTTKRKSRYDENGVVHFDGEPEYHGNPVDGDGSPVTFHYGYDFVELINRWAGYDVELTRFWDETHGILGEMTEVYICRKRGGEEKAQPISSTPQPNIVQSKTIIPEAESGVHIVDRFSQFSNEEWLAVLQRSITEPVINGIEFPRFPHSAIQLRNNGATNEEALLRAHAFWVYAEKWARALGKPFNRDTKVLDLGCGWGRTTRMFTRNVPGRSIFGCDIDRDILAVCRALGVPGQFAANEVNQPLPYDGDFFSVITANSVLTHLTEDAALSMFAEMSRVAQKGCLFVFTVEDDTILDTLSTPGIASRGERWRLLATHNPDIPSIRERYQRGEYVYLAKNSQNPNSANANGDALVSRKWLEEKAKPYFRVRGYYPAKAPVYQAVVVATKE